jgi:hypothetical protein
MREEDEGWEKKGGGKKRGKRGCRIEKSREEG